MGGFSRASKKNDAGAFTNWAADEQGNCSNDIEQFGQLLATLLGHCHGSSEYIKVSSVVCFVFTIASNKVHNETVAIHPCHTAAILDMTYVL